MNEERRSSARASINDDHIQIYDRNREQIIGIVANISETGFMLVSSEDIEPGSVFQLEMRIKDEGNIRFGATCLWSAEANTPNMHWQGFHIIDISSEAAQQMRQVMAHLL